MTEDELIQLLDTSIKECFCLFAKSNPSIEWKTCDLGKLYFGKSIWAFDMGTLLLVWDIGSRSYCYVTIRFVCHKSSDDLNLRITWKYSAAKLIEFDPEHNGQLKCMIDKCPEIIYPILRMPEIIRNFIDEN